MVDMAAVLTTLVQLAFMSSVLSVGLEQIFKTQLYQHYLGKGPLGEGSRFFTHFELRPWISLAAGLYMSIVFETMLIAQGTRAKYLEQWDSSRFESFFEYPEVIVVDILLTGLVLGGGSGAIKMLAKRFMETRGELQNIVKV